MNGIRSNFSSVRLATALLLGIAIAPISIPSPALAQTPLKRATITKLRNRVRLKPKTAKLRKAKQRDTLTPGDQLATGRFSFAEFRFNEGTLARMGERAIFRFIPRTRNFVLNKGTVLLLIPPGQGRTQVRTPNVRTGIRGSALFIRHDEARDQTIVGALTDSGIEVNATDGTFSKVLKAGEIVVIGGGKAPESYNFNLAKFYETSALSEGILDGTVGPAAVLEEIQAGLAAQGNFETASKGEVTENPSFVKLANATTDGAEATNTAPVEPSAQFGAADPVETATADEITSLEGSIFPGRSLGLSVDEEADIVEQPVPVDDPKLGSPSIGDPNLGEPVIGDEPELGEPDVDEPGFDEPGLGDEPEPEEPDVGDREIDEPGLGDELELDKPGLDEPDIDDLNQDEPDMDDFNQDEPDMDDFNQDESDIGDEPDMDDMEGLTQEPDQALGDDFPGRGNGVADGAPGKGNGFTDDLLGNDDEMVDEKIVEP